jgi:hypothetical protein
MTKQHLKDKIDALLGTIETKRDGRQEIRDSIGALKGRYDPKFNQTR